MVQGFWKTIAVLMLGIIVSAGPSYAETIKIGTNTKTAYAGPLIIARGLGFFAEEGGLSSNSSTFPALCRPQQLLRAMSISV